MAGDLLILGACECCERDTHEVPTGWPRTGMSVNLGRDR
jgi:hypothetical protein